MAKYLQLILLFISVSITNVSAQKQLHLLNNGEISWVDIGDMDIAGNQITVEALIFIEKEPDNFPESNIISKHTNGKTVNYLFRPYSFTITTYRNGDRGDTDLYKLLIDFEYDFNKWYHVAATYDGETMKYFVNGCLVAERQARGNLYQNNFDTAIGNRSETTNEQFWGWLDEVRIWKTVRTEAEIQANMLEVNLEPGLVGYYKFDGDLKNSIGTRFHDGHRGRPGRPLAIDRNPVVLFEIVEHEIIEPSCFGGNDASILVISNADYEYSLTGNDFTDNQEFSNLTTGNYQLHIRGKELCYITDDFIEVTEPERITTTFREEICIGDSIEFKGNFYLEPGNYTETLEAQNGCDSFVIFSLRHVFNEFLGKDTTLCSTKPFTIKSTKPNTVWLGFSPGQNLTVNQSGLYIGQYENEKGCLIQDSISVEFLDSIRLFVPSAFSPNDDGINDFFEPYIKEAEAYKLWIYDRWGNLIFNKNEGWDGRYQGKRMNTGIYLWRLEITRDACGTMEKVLKSGDLTLFGGRN